MDNVSPLLPTVLNLHESKTSGIWPLPSCVVDAIWNQSLRTVCHSGKFVYFSISSLDNSLKSKEKHWELFSIGGGICCLSGFLLGVTITQWADSGRGRIYTWMPNKETRKVFLEVKEGSSKGSVWRILRHGMRQKACFNVPNSNVLRKEFSTISLSILSSRVH